MSKKAKRIVCIGCGKLFKRSGLNRSQRCFKCTREMMIKANTEMHNKSGAAWERYKVGMKAYLARIDK